MSGHVRGAPPGSRSGASGYGSREGERGVMGERGGGQVSHLFVFVCMSERLENAKSHWKNDHVASHKSLASILAVFKLLYFRGSFLLSFLISQEIPENVPNSS